MIYLKSVLAGIAGSILAIILLVVVIIVLNITKVIGPGMVGVGIISFIPLGLILLGFVAGYSFVFSKLRRRTTTIN